MSATATTPNLAELLEQAQAIRHDISSVSVDAHLFSDGEQISTYRAYGLTDRWSGDSPEELLQDIKEWR